MNKATKIITHTAVSQKYHTAQDIDIWHKARWDGFTSDVFKNDLGQPYHVGYHFVIEWDGKIVPTRGVQEEGAHCIGQNTVSIGVCFIGDGDKHMPSPQQKSAWKKLYKQLHIVFPNITEHDTYPHRKYANKTCHGSKLSDTYFADLLLPKDVEQLQKTIVNLQQQLISLLTLLVKKRMSLREKN